MACIPTNKPYKNTEAEKCWSKALINPQRIYPTSHLFVELRYYAVNTADKTVGQTFPNDQTFSCLKLKLNRHLNATTWIVYSHVNSTFQHDIMQYKNTSERMSTLARF